MNTDKKAVELRVLRADEGIWLRRKDAQDPIHFTKIVYLGSGDSEENYIEVSDEEKAAYDEAHAPANADPTSASGVEDVEAEEVGT